MFLHIVKYSKKGVKGCYCSLMESYRDDSGKPVHKRVASIGFVAEDRVPFLKAAFTQEDPYEVLSRELRLLGVDPEVLTAAERSKNK